MLIPPPPSLGNVQRITSAVVVLLTPALKVLPVIRFRSSVEIRLQASRTPVDDRGMTVVVAGGGVEVEEAVATGFAGAAGFARGVSALREQAAAKIARRNRRFTGEH